MASNKVLRQILQPYGRGYCFTDAIIQGARTEARKLIFGDADDNVTYAHFMKEDLEKAGHHVLPWRRERALTEQKQQKGGDVMCVVCMDTCTKTVFY
jgi:hypothetical protein